MRARRAASVVLAALVALSTACGGASSSAQQPTTARRQPTTATPPLSPSPRPMLAGKVVTIDPGHNGGNAAHPEVINRPVDIITGRKPCNTTGTQTAAGYTEHAFTWDVARRLTPILRKMGVEVVLTRPNDSGVGPCINVRAAIGNKAKADAVVSIHADGAAANDHGFHVILPGLVPGHNNAIIDPSRRLGLAVRDTYTRGTGLPFATYVGREGLDTRTDLGGLNLSTRPAVFVECGNMGNRGDAAKLSDPAFRQRIAVSLADGLRKYFDGQ